MWFTKTIVLSLIICAKCSIIPSNETKSSDLKTTIDSEHNNDLVNMTKAERVKSELQKEQRVYLEDVFYTLKSQTWPPEEQLCLNQTLTLLTNLQNFTLWAVSMWDSMASEPRGVLYGSSYQLSNFDECLKMSWLQEYPQLRTQYCLADVQLLQGPRTVRKRQQDFSPYQSALDQFYHSGDTSRRRLDRLTWGVCVPRACGRAATPHLVEAILRRSSLALAGLSFNITLHSCQTLDEDRSFDTGSVAFYSLCGVLVALATACTGLHYYLRSFSRTDEPAEVPALVAAFSLLKNAPELLTYREGGLETLYGIRFISICLIVMSHRFGMYISGPLSNGVEVDQLYQKAVSIFFVHDDLLVDTFFMMSGLLATQGLLATARFPNPLLLILKRYVRLAAGLALMVLYTCTAFIHSGSGPLWKRNAGGEVAACRDTWWAALLMIGNYAHSDNMCLVVSWYVPCDFHLFVLAVVLCGLHRRCARAARTLAGVVTVAAVAAPGLITAYYNLPALLLFFENFLSNPRGDETFQRVYIKTHTRAAAYLVGVAAGYVLARSPPSARPRTLPMRWTASGACLGMAIMFTVLVTGVRFYEAGRPYSAGEAALYAALNRPAWAAGLALLVLCCAYGPVPLVRWVLCWRVWAPLSRLAYGIYLTHTLIITRDVASARGPQHFDIARLLLLAAGDVCWSSVAALVLWLLLEAPAVNLLSLALQPQHGNSKVAPSAQDQSAQSEEAPSSPAVATDDQADNVRSNLPPVIFRSKC